MMTSSVKRFGILSVVSPLSMNAILTILHHLTTISSRIIPTTWCDLSRTNWGFYWESYTWLLSSALTLPLNVLSDYISAPASSHYFPQMGNKWFRLSSIDLQNQAGVLAVDYKILYSIFCLRRGWWWWWWWWWCLHVDDQVMMLSQRANTHQQHHCQGNTGTFCFTVATVFSIISYWQLATGFRFGNQIESWNVQNLQTPANCSNLENWLEVNQPIKIWPRREEKSLCFVYETERDERLHHIHIKLLFNLE